ncbi:MAG: YeeE/YedE thiosulfate transporter family protein [Candidatus Binataceae bacterium]
MHLVAGITAPLWVGLIIGFVIGLIGEVWGLGNPEMFIRLARLQDRLLAGCFLISIGFGSILLYLLYAWGVGLHLDPKPLTAVGVTVGGSIFGAGLAVSGYAPGSVFMALGEGRRDSLFALGGGLAGAAAWTGLYQSEPGRWISGTLNYGDLVLAGRVLRLSGTIGKVHVFEFIGSGGRWTVFVVAFVYGVLFLAAARRVKRFGPSSNALSCSSGRISDSGETTAAQELTQMLSEGGLYYRADSIAHWLNYKYVTSLDFYSAPMLLSGLAVALVVTGSIVLHQTFGESTTYSWLVGRIWMPDFDYSQTVFRRIGWEPFSSLGTFAGALTASVLFTRRFGRFKQTIPPSWRGLVGAKYWPRSLASFGGTFLVLFGARMANGCTSGHILSGGLQMSLSGLVFAVAVSVSMILTARLLYEDAPNAILSGERKVNLMRHNADGSENARGDFLLLLLISVGNVVILLAAALVTKGTESEPITLDQWITPALLSLLLVLLVTAVIKYSYRVSSITDRNVRRW